jgi:hypothetical protein
VLDHTALAVATSAATIAGGFAAPPRYGARHPLQRPLQVVKPCVRVQQNRQLGGRVPRESLRFFYARARAHDFGDVRMPQRVEVGDLPVAVLVRDPAAARSRGIQRALFCLRSFTANTRSPRGFVASHGRSCSARSWRIGWHVS